VLKICLRWFVRHLDALAVHIELPSMVNAAKAAFLITAKIHGCSAVRAFLVEDTNPPLRISERNEIFTEQTQSNGITVGTR
jgi:hypothetical protein